MIHSNHLENTEYPVVISYYTIGTVYENEINKLIDTLDKFKLPYQIYGVLTLGSWLHNTGYKAEFVERVLEIIDRPCVWLDADCIVMKTPTLFAEMLANKVSMGVYIRGDDKNPNLNSSTVYFGNDAFCKETVKKWALQVKASNYQVWDQKCLEYVYLENPMMYHKIPPDYAKKAKMGKLKNSVIFQNNISTETRGSEIDTSIDVLRYICSHDDLIDEVNKSMPKDWRQYMNDDQNNISWCLHFGALHYETFGKKEIDTNKRMMYDFNPLVFIVNYPEYSNEFVINNALKQCVNFKDNILFHNVYSFYIQKKVKLNLEKNPSKIDHFEACSVLHDVIFSKMNGLGLPKA